jgi:hypothetical protein
MSKHDDAWLKRDLTEHVPVIPLDDQRCNLSQMFGVWLVTPHVVVDARALVEAERPDRTSKRACQQCGSQSLNYRADLTTTCENGHKLISEKTTQPDVWELVFCVQNVSNAVRVVMVKRGMHHVKQWRLYPMKASSPIDVRNVFEAFHDAYTIVVVS